MHGVLWGGVSGARKSHTNLLELFRQVHDANKICSTLTLVLPYIVEAINEKLLYIFGAVNVISIPIGEFATHIRKPSLPPSQLLLTITPYSLGTLPRI